MCNECGGTVIEYDTAAGNGFCVGCGTVVEESVIVSEIGFGEADNGAAVVQGSFVAQGASMCMTISSVEGVLTVDSPCSNDWAVWKPRE